MKKIGSLDNGNLLIQMTSDEWGKVQEEFVVDKELMQKWRGEFYEEFRLGLKDYVDRKILNLISDAVFSAYNIGFRPGEDLLGFEEWCDYTLLQEGRNLNFKKSIRNRFSEEMKSQLLDGIRRYKAAKE